MNRLILLITILALLFFTGAYSVSAHEDESDGSVTATLHIEPADSPAANSTSILEFIFQDSTGRFNLKDCDCNISIVQSTSTIYVSELKESSLNFVFPETGKYIVEVNGEPKTKDQFSYFDLKFDTNVDRDEGEQISFWNKIKNLHFFHDGHWLHILIFGGGFLVCLYVIIFK